MDPAPRTAWLLACLGLSACGVAVPVKETEVGEQVPEQASRLVVGETDRASVRAQLGEPWLVAEDWNLDVFRVSGKDVTVPVMFVLWWPVPLGVTVDKTTVYVLVRYDDRGLVSAVANSLTRDAGFLSEAVVAGCDAGDAMLQLDPLRFSADADGKGALLSLDHDASLRYLQQHPPSGKCRLLLGCGSQERACAAKVKLDGEAQPPPIESMMKFDLIDGFHGALLPVDVPPGTHTLEISPLSLLIDYEATTTFSCAAGETRYGLLELAPSQEKSLLKVKLHGTLVLTTEAPPPLEDRRLLLWHDGRWLVH